MIVRAIALCNQIIITAFRCSYSCASNGLYLKNTLADSMQNCCRTCWKLPGHFSSYTRPGNKGVQNQTLLSHTKLHSTEWSITVATRRHTTSRNAIAPYCELATTTE